MENLLLPDTVVTVSDSVTGLIQVYTVAEFAKLFGGGQGTRVWSIWSPDGWVPVTGVDGVDVDAERAVTEVGDPSDLGINIDKHKYRHTPGSDRIRRSRFVAIHNNRNLLSCSESTGLVLRDGTPRLHEFRERNLKADIAELVLLTATPDRGAGNEGGNKAGHEAGDEVDDEDMGLLLLFEGGDGKTKTGSPTGTLDKWTLGRKASFFDNLACDGCAQLLVPGATANYYDAKKRHQSVVYCDGCLETVTAEFTAQLAEQAEMLARKVVHRRGSGGATCNVCRKPLSEAELYNYDHGRHHGKGFGDGEPTWYAHCASCYTPILKRYDRGNFKREVRAHPFEIVSVEPTESDLETLRRLFRNVDTTGEGEFQALNYGTHGGVMSQLLLFLGDRLGYDTLHFVLGNMMGPHFGFRCCRELASHFKSPDFEDSDKACEDDTRQFIDTNHYVVTYYLVNSTGTRLYLPHKIDDPHYVQRFEGHIPESCLDHTAEIDESPYYAFDVPLHSYDLPVRTYRISTPTGHFQAGIGGLVLCDGTCQISRPTGPTAPTAPVPGSVMPSPTDGDGGGEVEELDIGLGTFD